MSRMMMMKKMMIMFMKSLLFTGQCPANLSSLSLLQQADSERGDADRKSEVSTGAENAGFEPEPLGPTTVTERVGCLFDVFSESDGDK